MKKITLSLLIGFMSLVGFSQVGLVENFDAGVILPAGWTSDNGDYAVAFVENCAGRSVRTNLDDTNTDGHLTSPNIIGQSNGTDLTIAFDYKIVDWAAAVDATPPGWGNLMIQYSTNDGGIWNTLETIDDVNHVTANTCANFNTVLPAASIPIGTDFKLRINANWTAGTYYVYLDNIAATQVVVGPPSCVNLITPANGSIGVSINSDLEWSTATNIPTGYTIVVGTTPGGTDIADNINAGLSTTYDLPVLEYATTYYVSIIPFNGNGPAIDCPESSFITGADPNAPVDCAAGTPINTVYCYDNNETITWNFESSDGSPLNVFFNAGEMEGGNFDQVTVYDGIDNTGTILYDDSNGGNMTGISLIATSGFMFIEIDSDGSGSCQANSYIPLDFDVSCVDTTAIPNCNAILTTPANGAINVNVNDDLIWSPASILVTGYTISIGTTPGGTDIVDNLDVGPTLTYEPGTLLFETTYYVTIVPYNDNGPAINCNEQSFTTELNPYQCEAEDRCVFTFIIEDTFGDGWNGNTMSVSQDGLEIEVLELPDGTGPIEVEIPLCDGIPFELFWNAGGAFANEVVVSVIDVFDDEIFTMPGGSAGLQGTLLVSDIVNCTPPTCPRPTDIIIVEINLTTVEVSWTETGTADTWEIIVQPLGSGYPDGTEPEIIQTMNNPYLYEGLDPATQYEIYVSAICAVDDLSDWEGPLAFDTTVCDAAEQCLYTFVLEDDFGDGWNGNTMTVSQNGIAIQVLELADGSGPLEVQVSLCDDIPFELFWNDGGAFAGEVIVSVVNLFGNEIFTMPSDSAGLQGTELYSDIVVCPNCVLQTVSFNEVGDCNTDPDNPVFSIDVDITDLGGATTLTIIDDQGSLPQTTSTIGIVVFGPYPANTEVTVTVTNTDDSDCEIVSNLLTVICSPPPNECSIVYAGEDQTVDCDDSTTDLNAIYHVLGNNTGEYVVTNLDTCPQPPLVGGVPTSISDDDTWSEIINLGFDFEFFDQTYNQVIVGGNGVLSFEVVNAGTPNEWNLDPGDTLPNNVNTTITEANVFGVGHDMDPSAGCATTDINYYVVGSAPRRQFVLNFNVCHFQCNELQSRSQIILYETSNAVDINILEKPICAGWNDGNAVAGVQNINNTIAFTPPGRNTGVWEVTPDASESWRFERSQGDANYTLEWFNGTTLLGNTDLITVSPNVTTTYTVVITYELPDGTFEQISDDVVVIVETIGGPESEFNMTPTCDGGTAAVTGTPGGAFGFSPIPSDGAMIDPDTGTVTGGTPGVTYNVQYVVGTTSPCPASSIESVMVLVADDASFTLSPGCDGGTATVTGVPGGTFAFNPDPGDGAMIDPNTGTVTEGTSGASYTIEYTTNGPCTNTSTQTLNTLIDGGVFIEDFGEGIVPETIPYTTYIFNGVPQVNDGEYAVNNNASDLNSGWHDMEDHTLGDTDGLMFVVNAANVSGEFYRRSIFVSENTDYNFSAWITTIYDIDTAICPGTGVPANVTFRIENAAGALITDVNTGDIQNEANPNWQEYQLTFNTLVNSEVQIVLLNQGVGGCGNDLAIDDISLTPVAPMLSFIADCEGGTTAVTGSTGGTFTLNPEPGDGAEIDASTGTITNGIPGATYTIEYTALGGCSTTTLIVTLLIADDASFTMTPNCDGGTTATVTLPGGTFALNPVPTDGAMIDDITGTVFGGANATSYTVEYTTAGPCPATSSATIITLPSDDASFTITPTCDGGTASVALPGGTFVLNPLPTDGAMINGTTGTVSGGVNDTSYTVEYTTADICPATSTVTFTVLPADDASFSLTATCDSATATIIGDSGGTFVFNPLPTDGANINASTGTITGGIAGETYSVEYTTPGSCISSSVQSITLLTNVFDFNISGECNGAIFELTVSPTGGSYNPNTATYVLYDDMNSVLITNSIGDNVFEISESIFTAPMAGSTYNYVVEVTNAEGCVETNTVQVDGINCIIPQAISPNDDSYNDNFDLSGFDVSRLEIYNRHGIKVYSKTNYTNEWYGQTDNGKELPVGTYFYVMEYQGNKTKSSWVYINK